MAGGTTAGGWIALGVVARDGLGGQMFRRVSQYVAPPAGVASPLLWGTAEHVAGLFGSQVAETSSTERVCTFRFGSAEEFVAFFRRWYGPTLKAFESLGDADQRRLTADLVALAHAHDAHGSDD